MLHFRHFEMVWALWTAVRLIATVRGLSRLQSVDTSGEHMLGGGTNKLLADRGG